MRAVESLSSEASLDRAAALLRSSNLPALPISKSGTLLGVVTEQSLAQALSSDLHPYEAVELAVSTSFPTITVYESGAEALRRLTNAPEGYLLVLAEEGRVAGILTASDLYSKQPFAPRPPMVGGMATPFGVYLTNGSLGAGVPSLALVSTGIVMFIVFAGGIILAMGGSTITDHWRRQDIWNGVWNAFPLVFLFVSMRLSPLAGIHAAEHKVVHAIERGEALVPEVVGRMPRVHPRCGTNLFAGSMIFVGFYEGLGSVDDSVKLLVAALTTFLLWRPVGSAVQFLFTTRPPNRKQIDMGIKAGKELLEKYRMRRSPPANPFMRIWNSGMVHVLVGFSVCEAVAWGIGHLLHVSSMPF